MSIWDGLTVEERVILTNAIEEAWLNNVIGDFLGHAEHGGAVWMSSTDKAAIGPFIPRFAAIVKDMIHRDLIELVPGANYRDWPHTPRMTDAEIDAALADPETWLPSGGAGPIMLITTGRRQRRGTGCLGTTEVAGLRGTVARGIRLATCSRTVGR